MVTVDDYLNTSYNSFYSLQEDTIHILEDIQYKRIIVTEDEMDMITDKIIKHKKIELLSKYPTNILNVYFLTKILTPNQIGNIIDCLDKLLQKKQIYIHNQQWLINLLNNNNLTQDVFKKLVNLELTFFHQAKSKLIEHSFNFYDKNDLKNIFDLYKKIDDNSEYFGILLRIINEKKIKIKKDDFKNLIEISQGKYIDKIYQLYKTKKVNINFIEELLNYNYLYDGIDVILKDISDEESIYFIEKYIENKDNLKMNINKITEIIINHINKIKKINVNILYCLINTSNISLLEKLIKEKKINLDINDKEYITKTICLIGNMEIFSLFKRNNLLELTDNCFELVILNEKNSELIRELLDNKVIPSIKTLTLLPDNYYGQRIFNIIKDSYLIKITPEIIKLLLSKNIIVGGIQNYIESSNIETLYKICHDVNRFPPEYESYIKQHISKEVLEFRKMFLSHSIEYIEKKIKEGMIIDQYCYENLFLNYYYRTIKNFMDKNYKDKFTLSHDAIMRIENKSVRYEQYEIYKINNNR